MTKSNYLTSSALALTAVLVMAAPAMAGAGSSFPFEAPPDARPGECFARVMVPAQYDTVSEQIVVDEGGSRVSVTQAQFAPQTRQVMVRDAGVRYEVRQPVYRTVSEQVMVRPGFQKLHVTPAEYRTVTEQVQVSAPTLAWKPGKSLGPNANFKVTQTRQGEVFCLVEQPGEVQNISKRVQVRQEQVRAVDVPPVYQNITRQVMVDPGGVREIPVPPQFATITTQHMVQQGGHVVQQLPPKYGTVNRRVQVAPESFRWVRVLCQTNATPAAISEVQGMLHRQGYYQGPINGSISQGTERAIASYQQQMHIPHGGFLSVDTVNSLRSGASPVSVQPSYVPQGHSSHTSFNNGHGNGTSYGHGHGAVAQSYRSSGWQSSAPAQFNYAGSSSQSGWSSAGAQSGWNSTVDYGASHYGGQAVYQEGQVISRIPSGEHVTNLQAEAVTGGVSSYHTGGRQLLSWTGK